MILLRLAGGLGNQLFQVMTGLLLAGRSGRELVPLTGGLQAYATTRQPDVLRLLGSPRMNVNAKNGVGRLARWSAVNARAGRWMPILRFSDADFPGRLAKPASRVLVDGYFQRGWNTELLREATSQVEIRHTGARPGCDAFDCLIHMRGGDFLRLQTHAFLTASYYERCIEMARLEGCRTFGIVTDDQSFARTTAERLQGTIEGVSLTVLAPSSDGLDDFNALRLAQRRIVGNSTFAWWACALGDEHAITWSPDRFVRDEVRDYFLSTERTIPAR